MFLFAHNTSRAINFGGHGVALGEKLRLNRKGEKCEVTYGKKLSDTRGGEKVGIVSVTDA